MMMFGKANELSMKSALLSVVIMCLAPLAQAASNVDGHITDATTGKPIADAVVTVGTTVVKGDAAGHFLIVAGDGNGDVQVMARAPGYRAASVSVANLGKNNNNFSLTPFTPHALYLSVYGIASKPIRHAALDIIHRGGANALVVDIKSDRGLLTYPSQIPLAQTIGARRVTLTHSLTDLVSDGHAQGIYMIARIVTFKDATLGVARPDLAVHLASGELFHDREGLTWTDSYQPEVRAYNIAIAVEAAKAGFDEVQFDYVRFPDSNTKLSFHGPTDEAGRVKAITAFLAQAHAALVPYNVFQAADIFGYVGWNLNDTGIGQQLQDIVDTVDYVCPMLYPSGFKAGIPGHKNPMATDQDIYDTVRLTIDNSIRRTHANPKKFRPWLQAFRDYAFGGKVFGPVEVADQIRAADDAGSDGWILWNPHNRYTDVGLTKERMDGSGAKTSLGP
jgi:hypothetical protein